jgi:hypothetical protein
MKIIPDTPRADKIRSMCFYGSLNSTFNRQICGTGVFSTNHTLINFIGSVDLYLLSYLSFCSISFDHCNVCPFSISDNSLWYLQDVLQDLLVAI